MATQQRWRMRGDVMEAWSCTTICPCSSGVCQLSSHVAQSSHGALKRGIRQYPVRRIERRSLRAHSGLHL